MPKIAHNMPQKAVDPTVASIDALFERVFGSSPTDFSATDIQRDRRRGDSRSSRAPFAPAAGRVTAGSTLPIEPAAASFGANPVERNDG